MRAMIQDIHRFIFINVFNYNAQRELYLGASTEWRKGGGGSLGFARMADDLIDRGP